MIDKITNPCTQNDAVDKVNEIIDNLPTSVVNGVKGNAESNYRTGQVNLTPANIGAVAKSGDTMTGQLVLQSNVYGDSYTTGALDCKNSNILNVNSIYTADASDNAQEGIHFYRDATSVDSLHARSGTLYFTPNRTLGTAGEPRALYSIPNYQIGTTDLSIRPLISRARANRLSFLPATQVIIEKTTDGGTTWEDAGISDAVKKTLFARMTTVYIPLLNGAKSTQCGLRVTITGMRYNVPDGTAETNKYNYWNSTYVKSTERYFNVREWWFWVSANSDTIRCEIQRATGANPNTWTNVFNTDFGMTGWSGSDWIRAGNGATFGGGTTQTGNNWNWRLIFWSRIPDGKTEFQSATQQSIATIRCYGDNVWNTPNNLMADDHLYSYDDNQNATFPAKVTATGGFSGNVDGGSKWLLSDPGNRPASANSMHDNNKRVRAFLASSSMTTGKPPGDAHMLHFNWDNGTDTTGTYDAQLALTSSSHKIYFRSQNPTTWSDWFRVFHEGDKPSLDTDVTGTLSASNGGTGETNLKNACISMINALDTGNNAPSDTDYFVSQYVGGNDSNPVNTNYYRRPISKLWEYIQGKISSVLGLTASAYSGKADTAGTADKLGTDAGSGLNPVYFSNGVPVASNGNSIPFIVGTGSTAGTWLGTLTGLTAYYDGLLILYKPSVAGATTTTLNLNNLGAVTCYVNNTTKLTTHHPVNQPIMLVYSADQNSGCWMCIDDYWTNTVPQAYCETKANVADKAAGMTNYTATANTFTMVNMRYANTTASALTLNINSQGAKPIYINGTASSSSNYTLPAGSYLVYYDGTNYYFRTDGKITGSITGNADTATKLAIARNIDGVSFDGSISRIHYGVATSSGGDVAVSCSGFELVTGSRIIVKFTGIEFTANNLKMNVNSTGAKTILYQGSSTNTFKFLSDGVYEFVYDGTNWNFVGFKGSSGSTAVCWYATSDTAAATSAKEATCSGFTLETGSIVNVSFSTANTVAGALTLDVNSTGAKTVYLNGAATSTSNAVLWNAGEILTFTYNGSNWMCIGQSGANTWNRKITWTAPTVYSGRCTIEDGGYYREGQHVYIQVAVKLASALSSGSTVQFASINGIVPNISRIQFDAVTSASLTPHHCTGVVSGGNLYLTLYAAGAIATTDTVYINGQFICS